MTDQNYCARCGGYTLEPLVYDGKSYCGKCFTPTRGVEDGAFAVGKETKVVHVAPPGANIPLHLQKRLLHARFYDQLLALQALLEDDEFLADLEKMCELRMEGGYPEYGSRMFDMEDGELWGEQMEELADFFNWGIPRA